MHHHYNPGFGDQTLTGMEFIHHGARTATNGDVRLSPTPEQWDPVLKELEGRAGFNMEFLPSAYAEKTSVMDGQSGVFPRPLTGPMHHSDATPAGR